MKIMVLGLRAVPGVAGGVETHCEHLYPLVAKAGVEVEIVVRTPYAAAALGNRWRGVRIRRIWSPRMSGLETVLHTFLGVLYAGVRRPDVLHLHAIGPALFSPLARLLGLNVVVTHHGADYERAKWGPIGKRILRLGERLAMRYANAIISVSRSKANDLARAYQREPIAIPNGVPAIVPPGSDAVLRELGLVSGRYVLHVGRSAPEKRQDDLVSAFVRARLPGWKLVIVGDMTGRDAHSTRVRELASGHEDIVLAGFRSGDELRELLTQAGCFALPSTIEGFSIALLEALSAGCPVVASDISANHEIELPAACYFPVGDIAAMADALSTLHARVGTGVWTHLQRHVRNEYGWRRVASQTLDVYNSCVRKQVAVVSPRRRADNSSIVRHESSGRST